MSGQALTYPARTTGRAVTPCKAAISDRGPRWARDVITLKPRRHRRCAKRGMPHIAGPSRSGRSALRQQTTPPRNATTFQIVGNAHAAWYRNAQAKPVSGQALTYPLAIFVLVYNLVRVVMLDASQRRRVPLDRVSFVDALRWLCDARHGHEPRAMIVNPKRPDRVEPRVVKRRPKSYKLMTKPRAEMKKELENKGLAA